MKKLTFYLGSLILAFGFCWIPNISYSQNVKFTRQEQKEARRAEIFENFKVLDTMLLGKSFVLEADYLENQYGNKTPVSSTLNFIRVDSTSGVLQTGNNVSRGYNGVGGVTAEGNIGSYKIVKDLKNLSYFLQFSVLTNVGAYDVSIMVSADSYARATITGLGYGKLIYDGHMERLSHSRVYKGQNTL